jgi:hypothetical protein
MERDKSRIELVLPHCLVNSYMARIYRKGTNVIRLQNAHGREVIFLVHPGHSGLYGFVNFSKLKSGHHHFSPLIETVKKHI